MNHTTVVSCYHLLAELLLYPEERREESIRRHTAVVESAPENIRRPLLEFSRHPDINDCGSYLADLEMSGKRPLYLGFYLFDEPETCQSAGTCGRNGYMIELSAIYRHYGLQVDGREMPDFLPLVLDFLALSADRRQGEEGSHRTRLIQRYIQPAALAMQKRFTEDGGPWLLALDAAIALLQTELDEPGVLPLAVSNAQPINLVQLSAAEGVKELT